MSKFHERLSQPKDAPAEEGMEIEGAFGCQMCHEQVDTALYYDLDRLLVWTCHANHRSYIEDFIL